MQTVGVFLKKEREARNLSLREVAHLTKISELYLACIEKDDYEKLPQGPYIKGYISNYSRSIGSDVDEALKLYDSLNKKKDLTESLPPQIPTNSGWKSSVFASLNSIVASFSRRNKRANDSLADQPRARAWKPSVISLKGKSKSTEAAVRTNAIDANGTPAETTTPSASSAIPDRSLSSSLRVGGLTMKTSFRALRVEGSALKTTGAAISRSASSTWTNGVSFLKATGSFFRKTASALVSGPMTTHRRSWMIGGGLGIVAIAILVLAGFGFYHLFIFSKQPPLMAEAQRVQKKANQPQPVTNTGKNAPVVLPKDSQHHTPGPSPIAKAPSVPPKPVINTGEKAPASPPKDSRIQTPSPASIAKKTSIPPKPVIEPDRSPPERSIVATAHAASDQTSTSMQSRASSDAGTKPTGPSPEPIKAPDDVNVLKASICSDIKDRMPASVGSIFPHTVERIYVWNQVEAKKIPAKVRHIYYLEGEQMSDVTLNVLSPAWRTWSFKTILEDRYRGHWRVDIATMDGEVLRRLYFTIE